MKISSSRVREARESLVNRLEGFLYALGDSLECSQGHDLVELRKHNVVYDVAGLSSYHRSFLIAFDVVSALRYHRARGMRGLNARLLYVFDEAHTVFSKELRGRTSGTGDKPLLLEAYPMLREFGIGVFCLSQSPRNLDETTVLSNSACKIVKNQNDGKDMLAMAASQGLDAE